MDGVRVDPSAHRAEPAAQQPVRGLGPRKPGRPVRQAVPVAHRALLPVFPRPRSADGRGGRTADRLRAVHRGQVPGAVRRVRAPRRGLRAALGDGRRRFDGAPGPVVRDALQLLGGLRRSGPVQRDVPGRDRGSGGRWLARAPGHGRPALAVADIDLDAQDPDVEAALRYARPWRRTARAGLYEGRQPTGDPRSETRTAF
ncbi:hypothetical protein KCH_05460 [Kitasatospora cheerisanensis KCTC 2395]|uniref:Uncharacterized protein n=1 Tax=Kitasatospora cheerisanensis KCTC 2395 TaxID=1348663 RepID=A0A066ZBM5_9ACTN|nr:hypothetical protein KCH_05460 [Kitasatospora cheerisanensis KCTC 2395]